LNRQEGVEASILKDKLFIANMYAGLERNDKARKGFYAALPDVRASGQPDLEWGTHLGIGHTFMKENSDSARFHYERTLQLIEETRSGLKGAEIRTGYLSGKRRFIYEEIARYYASQHKMDEEGGWSDLGFRTIERAKARGLLDLLEVSLLAESPPDEMAVLDSLYQYSAEHPEDKEMHSRLERRYINMREARLSEAIGPLKSASTTATIPNIQDALPKGTVLLEYALGDTASLLWVIDQKTHSIHELPNRQSIRMDIERLRDAIARPGAGDAALTNAAWRLYEKLILPVEKKIRKAKQLVIVPDGILFELPFEVLITKETDAGKAWDQIPFFAKTHTTLYIPSASIYLRLMIGEAKKTYTQELVAFGDPDFSLLKDAASKSQAMLAPLPHTRVEVNNIAAYLDEPHRMIFLGDKATEGELKNTLRTNTPRLLHLATHGLVDPIDPQASSIVLCPDSDTNDDGYLHTLEILNLPLKIRLVVMSACESARGRIGRGEGVVGLSRAFIAGGAGGVVASLWSVSDQSTAELMNVFYKEMVGKKKSAGEALRKARLMLLEHDDYAHPFYWSAFIMIGTTESPW
jgi:CHAT domain-containing protein